MLGALADRMPVMLSPRAVNSQQVVVYQAYQTTGAKQSYRQCLNAVSQAEMDAHSQIICGVRAVIRFPPS